MESGVLVFVLLLAGQLSQLNDRYSGANGQSPPPANNAAAGDPDSSVIPILESPPAETQFTVEHTAGRSGQGSVRYDYCSARQRKFAIDSLRWGWFKSRGRSTAGLRVTASI